MVEYNEAIHDYLNSLNPISKKNMELLLGQSEMLHFTANSAIVNFNDKPENIYLLAKGVVRSYILLESGKEVTKTLFTQLDLFSSFTSLLNQSASNFCYQTLTDCDVLAINFVKFKEMANNNIEILKLYTGYLEKVFSINEEKHLEVLSKDAKARYLSLRDRIPNVDNLIPQYQIASFLNITPVQLSRIRSQLK